MAIKQKIQKKIELFRKTANLIILFFAFSYYFTGLASILLILLAFIAVFIPLDVLYFLTKGKSRFLQLFFKLYPKRQKEYESILTDASILLLSTFFLVLIFPKDIAILTMIILTFADVAEHVFGIKLPWKKLFWNEEKNWSGTLAGFFAALTAGILAINFLKLSVPLAFLVPATVVAALAGTLKDHDNLAIAWSVAILLYVLAALF